ncbi:MAG: sulfatase-like hydrolase/transferase, partial [Acidobacteriota bacterium]
MLVTLDTTRPDRLQPYGARDVATPTLLRIAREGVVFEEAMAVAPITLVAHTSLLTGLYPPRHGVRNNGIHFVDDGLETVAETLGEHGYRSAAFVSASVLEARYGLDQGFDAYDDDLSTGTNRQPRVVPDRAAGDTVDAATRWLDTVGDERFFLWVHFYDPHAVYSPPAPYRDRYRDRLYDGEIAYMDAELGRLLEHPALADAALAVVGDHGESLGEHGEQTHAILAYQATLHVPFLLRIPGGPEGLRIAEPVSHVDLVPTALDLLGLPAAPEGAVDGRSLVPLLEGADLPGPEAELHYAETYLPFYTYGWAKLQVLRRGTFKLIDGPDPELYRLDRDADETQDLAERDPETLADLRRQLAERMGEDGDLETTLELDDEALDRLRSLGYLASGRAPDRDGPRPDPKAVIDLHVGLERARHLLRDRRPDEAERQLRRVLERDGSNLAALAELSTARELQGDLDGAVEAAERALALDPGDPRMHVVLARLEVRQERPNQALQLLDAALALDPRHLDGRLERVALLGRLGRRVDAADALRSLAEDEGEHPRVLVARAQTMPPQGAEVLLRRALDADPYLVTAWRALGRQLDHMGRVDDALGAYRAGLERTPDDPDLHALLGRLLARTGGDADVHLREALRLTAVPRPEVKVALGAHLAERGQFHDALALYGEVLTDDPGHVGARNNRAVALYRMGQVEAALGALEALAREHPDKPDA